MGGRWLLLSLVVVVGFAPAPLPRPSRGRSEIDDLKRFHGEWVVLGQWSGGVKRPPQGLVTRLVIVNDSWSFLTEDVVTSKWTARLTPSATPRAVDLRDTGNVTVKAIYRFDGGKLYFAYESAGVRPTTFDTSKGGYLIVLRRR